MKTSGIYMIENIFDGKTYVGSSIGIATRLLHHKNRLKSGRHANKKLQNAWNKYGEDSFDFRLHEICDDASLLEREQYYLDTLKPYYNIHRFAISNCHGYCTNEETKLKQSMAALGKPKSEETKMKIREARARQVMQDWSDERRQIASTTSRFRMRKNLTYEQIYGADKALEVRRAISEGAKGRTSTDQSIEMHRITWIKKMRDVYGSIFEMLDKGFRPFQILSAIRCSPDTIRKAIKDRSYIEFVLTVTPNVDQ